MAPRHAFTFQLADRDLLGRASPGHAATVVSTPQQQTYSGLGPAFHDWYHLKGMYSPQSFEPQVVPREETPPRSWDPHNYSTVSADGSYATYTVPVTEDQARLALAEIRRRGESGDQYNAFIRDYCTTDVNRNANAAGLGTALPYEWPGNNRDYLARIEKKLRASPRAKYVFHAGGLDRIPDALREIQQDYAFVGGGYDTPSERLGHVPSSSGPPNPHKWRSGTSPVEFVEPDEGKSTAAKAVRVLSRRTPDQLRAPDVVGSRSAEGPDTFDERFGTWTSSDAGYSSRNPNLPPPSEPGRPLGLVSGKPMPLWATPPEIWGDLGNSRTPVTSDVHGEPIEDWISRVLGPSRAR